MILFLLLGNFRAALITALAIPLSMLVTAIGMVQTKISGNLLSLGAIDFGIIVDGSVIIVENCLRMLAERQHQLGRTADARRAAGNGLPGQQAGAQRHRVRRGDHHHRLPADPRPDRRRGEDVPPDGADGDLRPGCRVRPVADVHPGHGRPGHPREGAGEGEPAGPRGGSACTSRCCARPFAGDGWWCRWRSLAFAGVAAACSPGSGQEFIPALDEQDMDIQTARIPSTGLTASLQTQQDIERTLGKFPQVERVFSKIGTAEVAADPMPMGKADTYVILKPRSAVARPAPAQERPDRPDSARRLAGVPGTSLEFTQPIQDRFNDLLAGTKGDVAVKVFGDDFEAMNKPAQEIAEDPAHDPRGGGRAGRSDRGVAADDGNAGQWPP